MYSHNFQMSNKAVDKFRISFAIVQNVTQTPEEIGKDHRKSAERPQKTSDRLQFERGESSKS